MIYPWLCNDCEHVTDAERRLIDMEIPPDKCEKCSLTNLRRIVIRPKGIKGYILEGQNWHHTDYHKNGPIK